MVIVAFATEPPITQVSYGILAPRPVFAQKCQIEDFHLRGGSQKAVCKTMPAFAVAMPSFALSLSPFTQSRVPNHASLCRCHAIVCLVSVALQMKIFDLKFELLCQRGECSVTVSRRLYAARGIIARRVAVTSASHHVNLNDMFDWAGNGSDDVL